MNLNIRLLFAAKLASAHLLISTFIAILTALLVFLIWYPFPYNYLVGGLQLFLLVAIVDVLCGPLLTLILASPTKSRRETILDLSLVSIIQLAALLYGLHAVYIARPVYYAFDQDRFSVVTAAQIDNNLLTHAPPELRTLPKTGIKAIALSTENKQDVLDSVLLSFSGVEPIARPNRWLHYNKENESAKIRRAMRPLKVLSSLPNNIQHIEKINRAAKKTGLSVENLYFLPLTSDKNLSWCTILNQQGEIVGYVDVDGFKEK